jgi:AcrR family transcriptional regulator
MGQVREPLTPERRRQQTRDYLLAAAAQVFTQRGFHGATLDEVAATAGFTKGAVYSNFKSKDDLFLALLEVQYDVAMEALHATLEGSEVPPEARLADFVALVHDEMEQFVDTWGVLYQEFYTYAMRNPAARERLAERNRANDRTIARIIAAERARLGINSEDPPEIVASILSALIRGIGTTRALDPDLVDDQ